MTPTDILGLFKYQEKFCVFNAEKVDWDSLFRWNLLLFHTFSVKGVWIHRHVCVMIGDAVVDFLKFTGKMQVQIAC